jgi:hypothetical protein
MQQSPITVFSSAIVICGLKLVQDFSILNVYMLEILLGNMQFYLKKHLPEQSIFFYGSIFYKREESTLIFLNSEHGIKKIRYLNVNLEKLAGITQHSFIRLLN